MMEDPDEGTRVEESEEDEPLPETHALLPAIPSTAAPLKLVVVSGRDFGKSLTLDKEPVFIGKAKEANLELTDPAVSRRHLVVEPLRGGCRFRDEGSKNGSFYGGSRFSVIDVPAGAVIRIGQTELQLMPVSQPPPLRPSEQT